MDLLYDIENLNDSAHQVRARITPLKCHQVCWLSALAVRSAPQEFRDESPLVCRDIESTTSVTYLRHLRQYAVQKHVTGYELVVETELNGDSEEGFVTLSALNLSKNGSKAKSKTFSTTSSNGTFHLPLSPDAVYAARYQYTKVKPFRYTTEEHFLIETAPLNSSKPSRPLIDVSFHVENGSRKGDADPAVIPLVTVSRGDLYRSREVRLHMGPFCDNKDSSTHVLAGTQPGYTVNLREAVCSHSPKTSSYCDAAVNYTKCGPMLCYSTSVVLDGDDYPSDVRCLNVTQHFPPVPSNSRSSYTFAILLILISMFI
ncbi:unnamed protein product [Heligmosomoides polygyrus]|uniref:MG2 domain-containing protein n=1 Tax=Heligmosomoides polygyrus TaxID=6339 RepID=A0A183GGN9_HELPZ|nr:unnamed protein product [Heligmosomoides polygyrus]